MLKLIISFESSAAESWKRNTTKYEDLVVAGQAEAYSVVKLITLEIGLRELL